MARPRRAVAGRPSRRELLVFTEGHVAEEAYLKHWHRHHRSRVNVEIHGDAAEPVELVARAAEAKRANERAERRGRGRAHDEVWCVFDAGAGSSLAEASLLASAEGIALAVSSPCIELWFLLHFIDRREPITGEEARRLAGAELGCEGYLDGRALALLEDRFPLARDRAQRLPGAASEGPVTDVRNPTSGMWRIVEAISTGSGPGR